MLNLNKIFAYLSKYLVNIIQNDAMMSFKFQKNFQN